MWPETVYPLACLTTIARIAQLGVMGNTFEVRQAQLGDWEQVQALYQQMHPTDSLSKDGREALVFEEILGSNNFFIFLLCDGVNVLATTYLNIIPNLTRGAAPYALVENVVTSRHMQRQGLGKKLMSHTVQYAWQRGCYKVMLMTGSKRESTNRFYRACGFDGDAKRGFMLRNS